MLEGTWKVETFIASVPLAASTLDVYARDLRDFADWAARSGCDGPASVTRSTVRSYLAHLTTRRYASRTIARKAAALRRYFDWMVRSGGVAVDPTAGVSAPGGAARLPRILKADELHQLLDEGPDRAADPAGTCRDDAVVEILYGSGLRVSELCGLDVDDVDLDRRRLTGVGQGIQATRSSRSASPPPRSLSDWLGGGRARLARGAVPLGPARRLRRRAVPQPQRPAPDPAGRPPGRGPPLAGAHPSPRASPHLRHSPAGRRCRSPGGPGAAGPRGPGHHAGLHPRQPRTTPPSLR